MPVINVSTKEGNDWSELDIHGPFFSSTLQWPTNRWGAEQNVWRNVCAGISDLEDDAVEQR